ncbi:protein odr-4 homolog [Mixophyes fleayi]|uniref:protein odr-4 homolog n=1 Tax=Mixophyes fleayi TaxID=3061075 RepID=UPI003F4D73D8
MGRSYYVDEAVEKYFTKIVEQKNFYVTGLLIGQCSLQRDYIILAVQTPKKEDQCEAPDKKAGVSKLDEIDEEWFSIHATQVSRMLPGGLQLVGVFLITSPELSKESQNALRKLIFAVEKSSRKNRLWSFDDHDITDRVALQICSATRKITCRSFDVSDPKSTAKPADWKYQSTFSSWLTIECNINVDLTIPLSSTSSYQEQQKGARNGLAQWAKVLEDSIILFNGQVKDKDADLFEEQKKSRSVANSCPQIVSANILTSPNTFNRSTAVVQVVKSSLTIHGVVKCRGYVCNNKPKVKDAMQAIKRDILNTISDRFEILFEDIILNGSKCESETLRLLPQRVFIPIPGSSTMLCDYVFGDETEEDLKNHFLEMLDQEVKYDALDFPEEKGIKDLYDKEQHDSYKSDNHSSAQTYTLKKEIVSSRGHQNMGLVIATAVGLLAVLLSFHCLSSE